MKKKHHHHQLGLAMSYTVAYWEAHQAQLDSGAAFNIADTAANIGAALNLLNGDSHIAQIVISDNASVTVNVSQLTGDATALSKLIDVNGSAAALTVSDTSAHIAASFATIATEGQVTKIVVSDNAVVTLTASQAGNYATAVGELINGNGGAASVHVKDTAANLATYLNGIEAAGAPVTEIIVSNSTAMTLSAAQISTDATALSKVAYNNGGAVAFKVSDTGANIGTYLDALQAQTKISTITDTNNTAITLSVAQITSDSGALSKLVNANASAYTLTVVDTAASVAADVGGLNGNSHVALVSISDSAADVLANLDALAGLTKAMAIALTDASTPTLAITDLQFHNDANVLSDITTSYTLTVSGVTAADAADVAANSHVTSMALADSTANVQSYLDNLENVASKISAIALTDGGTPLLSVTDGQYHSDAAVLAKITSSFNMAVTGTSVSDVATIWADARVSQIYVTDSAANIQIGLDTLESAASKIETIAFSNQGTQTLTITDAQFHSDASVISDIVSPYTLAVTHVSVSDATTVAANSHVTSVSISDSAANVQAALDTLESIASKITTIALTDSGTPTLTITGAQFVGDETVLSDIAGPYHLAVTSASASGVATIAANAHVTSIAVYDSATDVQANLASLEHVATGAGSSYAGTLTIALSDGGTPVLTLTESQFNTYAAALGDITSGFTLTLQDVLAADAPTLGGQTIGSGVITSLYVVDTAADIAASLGVLNAADGASITISDGSAIEISVAALEGDGQALAKLYAAGGVDHAAVTIYDTAADITAALSTLNSDTQVTKIIVSDDGLTAVTIQQITNYAHALSELYNSDGSTPAQLTVTDSAANISAAFDYLQEASNVSKIIVSDGGTVSISAAQVANDGTALSELYAANGNTHATVSVSDSAANVQTYLDVLESNHGYIASIVLTDSSTPTLTVSDAQLTNDTNVLGNIDTNYDLAVTGVLAANASGVASQVSGLAHAALASISVNDTAANISAVFDALNGTANVSTIVVNDSNAGQLVTISVGQFATDTTALSELRAQDGVSPVDIAIQDTAANISSAVDTLEAHVGSIGAILVSDSSSNEVTISVTQLLNDATALSHLFDANGQTSANVAVSDTAADIVAALSTLNVDTQVNKIIISDNSLPAVTVADITAYGRALGELYQSDGVTLAQLTVNDTAVNISGAFDDLNGASRVAKIVINDGGTVTIGAESAANDGTALAELYLANGASPGTVAVSDSAANVQIYLDGLETNHAYISSLTLTDSHTATLSVTETQLTTDATILGEIGTNYDLAVTHVLAADAASIAAQASGLAHAALTSISVSDTAANVALNLDTLNGVANLSAITLTDAGTPALTITEAQLTADAAALSDITNATYEITVTGATAANAASDAAANAHVTSIIVTDNAENIAANFGSLNSTSQVTQVIVSDSGSNEVTLSASAAIADTTAESLLYQSDGVTPAKIAVLDTAANVSGNVSALNANAHIDHVTVLDTAANVAGDFNQLNSVSHLAITLTDNGTPTLNIYEYQFLNDTNTLAAITNATYDIVLYQAQAANIASDAANSHVTAINVYDTEGNVEANFDALNSTIVSSISFNMSGEVTVSAYSAATDTHAEYLLSLDNQHVAVSDSAMNVATYAAQINANGNIDHVYVADTAANVESTLDVLNSVSRLSTITLLDSGTPSLTITESQLASDTAALGAITNTAFDIAVVNVAAANAASIAGDVHAVNAYANLTTIAVHDTAANISLAFDALNSVGPLSQIIVSDSGSNEVTLAAASAVSDTTAEGLLFQSDGTTPAHFAVSDTAEGVATYLDQLNSLSGLDHINLTSGALSISENQLHGANADLTALGLITTANFTLDVTNVLAADVGTIRTWVTSANANAHLQSISVTDTAADISGNIDLLSNTSHVGRIIVSDSGTGGVVTIDVAQADADQNALSELYQADGTDHAYVTVADTGAAISGEFANLVNNPYVDKFDVTDNAALTLSAQQVVSFSAVLGEIYNSDGVTRATINVEDTAQNISSNFDSLQGVISDLTKIIVSDSDANEVTIAVNQLQSDFSVLSDLFDSEGTTHANIAVEDSAANISGALSYLNSDTQVDHIIIADNQAISLDAETAINGSRALSIISDADGSPVSLTVSDTAADIASYLDQLNGISTVSSVYISDGNPLQLTAAQVDNDSAILAKLDAGSSITVSDTGADISAHLDALEANNDIISIVDADNSALTVTVAQLANDATVLSEITNADGVTPATIDVKDTAANIEAALADLNNNPTPQAIIISDNGALAMSVTQYANDTNLLARLENANGQPYELNISDNGANISAALDNLGGDSHIVTITDTNDQAITLSVAQIAGDSAALSILVNGDGSAYTLNVNDEAANISAALDGLNSNSHVTSIVVADSGNNEVVVSVAQLSADAQALGELYTDNTLATLANVAVSDIAANIQGALSTLNSDSQVNKIIVSDSGTNEIQVSVAELSVDAAVLAELYNADGITQANVAVADTAAILSGGELDTLNANTQVNKIIVTDSGSGGEITVSLSQLANDSTALGELYLANGVDLASVAVLDTAANIEAQFAGLNGNSQVDKVIVDDSGSNEVTISVSGLSYSAVLGELYDANGTTLAKVAVSDTAANIQADLSGLNANSQVDHIYVSDSASSEVTVSVAGITDFATALSELLTADGAAQASIAVADTAAAITSALDTLNADAQVNTINVTDANEVSVSVAQLTSDAHALAELYDNSGDHAGVSVHDTAANISAALDSLTAINSQVNNIVVTDSATNEVTVNVGQLSSDWQALSELYNSDGVTQANVTVSDVAYNISVNLDALNGDAQINKIIANDDVPGSGPIREISEVTFTVAQLTSDAHVLSELYQSDGQTLADVFVNDTAANISGAEFDALNNDSRVNGIVISDGETVTISAAQAFADTTALGELFSGNLGVPALVEVSDTAANIQSQLDNLNGNTHVGSIVVTDMPDFQLSAVTVGTDTTALGLIGTDNSGVTIEVTDTATNISAYLDALNNNPDITSITISDNGPITVSTDQLLNSDTTAISLLQNADQADDPNVLLTVRDSAANISAHLTDLEGYTSGSPQVASVVISDNQAVTVSVGDLSLDATVIGELSNADNLPYMLDVTGNASQIAGALDTLQSYAQGGHVQTITITDSAPVGVDVAQITSDAQALSLLSNQLGGGYSLAVSDTAADIAGDLSALNSNSHIASITLTDNGTPALTITESQLSDTTALGDISNATWDIAVTGVLAADASGIAALVAGANAHAVLTSISVSDSAANVAASLDSLNGLAHLATITLTDSGTPTLTLTEAQLTGDTAALDLITNASYDLAVTNVAAADAAGIAGDASVLTSHATLVSIAVSDTAADVQSALNALETAAAGNIPLTIALTDGGTPTLTISETQYHNDAAALSDITSAFQIAVTSVLAADAATIAADSRVTSISISDSAADVQSNLDSLENVASKITTIALTDGTTPTLTITGAQFSSDATVLGDISSPYNLAVTNVLAADAASVALDGHVTSISVYDTGAHISSALDALNSNTDVTTIVISDDAPLDLAAHSAALDSRALGLLVNQNGQPVSLTVTDSAANIATYLDTLNTIATISAITVADNNVLTLLAAQVSNDGSALAKVENANGQPIVINVSDTAAHITSYLDALEANTYIGTITVSDNLSVVASIAQLSSDADVLAALVNADGSNATVKVSDTAANISADLGNLNTDTQVTSIVISNNAQLALNVSEVVNDGVALGELSNANGTAATEKVTDTAKNIQTYLNNLQADTGITSIVVSNNVALTLTAAQVAHDGTALAEISNRNGGTVSFNVVDTGANISTYLDALAANAKIAAITVSDNSAILLSAAQLTGDAAALGKLVNQSGSPYTLTVEDTAANLSGAEFNSLNGNSHVTSIVISDNNPITLTIAELTNDTRALGELSNANGTPYSVIVTDTASNIASDLSTLNGNTHVGEIIVSDSGSGGTITLTAAQAVADPTALGELYQTNGTSKFLVNVTDTSADISANLNALAALAVDLGTITISDSAPISLNVTEFLNDGALFGKMINGTGHPYLLALSDTAAEISANIAALGQNTRIADVYVTDNGVVTATNSQYTQYNSLFYAIQGTHYIDITNVTGQTYTSYTETINGSHQVLLENLYNGSNLIETLQYTYNQDGSETINGSNITGKAYTSFVESLNTAHQETNIAYYTANGSLYENEAFTYNQDGTTGVVITGLAGINEETLLYAANGSLENQFIYYTGNSVTAYFYENGQTFSSNGETAAIKITSGTSGDTFNFTGSFGGIVVTNYLPGSETINWDHHDFANIAAVEAASRQSGGNTVVTLDANDTITLVGVTLSQFEAHTSDWHFI
jgi:PII-like signaling protein